MTRYISIAAIFLFSSANAQLLADDIDVLFVFGEDSFSKVTNKATWASGHEDTVNGYLSAAGVGQLNFDFRVHTSQIAFNANGMSAQAVLDWAQSGAGQTIVNSIRGDNDLVVIVVNDYSDGKCGRASRAENNINVLNGNTKFVVTIRLVDCGGDLSQLIAHELGHALYADHQ